jgi:hypothetical protein
MLLYARNKDGDGLASNQSLGVVLPTDAVDNSEGLFEHRSASIQSVNREGLSASSCDFDTEKSVLNACFAASSN